MQIFRAISLFILAGLAEIAGGYLVWQWLRADRSIWFGVLGAILLIGYGILPTLQPQVWSFGRVYAAYGGVFIVLSLAWCWLVDHNPPDQPSLIGACLALVGAAVILYWPR
ncbi:YnfA family protein [Herpetosiphon llansteffanensis]